MTGSSTNIAGGRRAFNAEGQSNAETRRRGGKRRDAEENGEMRRIAGTIWGGDVGPATFGVQVAWIFTTEWTEKREGTENIGAGVVSTEEG